jgi:hypothetical protein
MSIYIAERPASLDGCMQTWTESYASNTLRTDMEAAGYVKVRRRTTGKMTNIDATLTLDAKYYDDFLSWYFDMSQAGVVPTRIKRPQDGAEIVARFSAPPAINFIDQNAFTATMKFEQLPAWVEVK